MGIPQLIDIPLSWKYVIINVNIKCMVIKLNQPNNSFQIGKIIKCEIPHDKSNHEV